MKNIFIKQFLSIVFGMVLLFSLAPVHAMQQEVPTVKPQEVTSPSYWTRFKNFLHRTPLFPGWRSTEEQKAAAERTLANLLVEREKLEDERKSEQLSDERLQEISKELKRISDEINEQKVILGEEWSSTRRRLAAAGGLGLVGLAVGLGAKYAMSLPVPSLPGSFNKLVNKEDFYWEVTDLAEGKILPPLKGNESRNIKAHLTNKNKNKDYDLFVKDKNNEWKDAKYGIFYNRLKSTWRVREDVKPGESPKYFDIN